MIDIPPYFFLFIVWLLVLSLHTGYILYLLFRNCFFQLCIQTSFPWCIFFLVAHVFLYRCHIIHLFDSACMYSLFTHLYKQWYKKHPGVYIGLMRFYNILLCWIIWKNFHFQCKLIMQSNEFYYDVSILTLINISSLRWHLSPNKVT